MKTETAKQIRPNRELLEEIITRQHLFENGLCKWLHKLAARGKITWDEYDYIDEMINREYDERGKFFLEYIWEQGEIEPRIEWLKKKLGD